MSEEADFPVSAGRQECRDESGPLLPLPHHRGDGQIQEKVTGSQRS